MYYLDKNSKMSSILKISKNVIQKRKRKLQISGVTEECELRGTSLRKAHMGENHSWVGAD